MSENDALPAGWVWTRLGEISSNVTKGSTPTSHGYSYKKEGIKFIKTENIIENGNIYNITDFIDQETNLFLKRSVLQPNDILFSIAGTIGRVGIVQEKHLPANTNQALSIIRCFWNFIDNKYFFYFLKSPFIQRQALKSIVGVGRANISLTNIGDFLIPLPPLPEQRRIVVKIEELFTKLDAGVSALKKTQAQLKRYRQAVLRYALNGKLTEDWRISHKDEIEPATGLLEHIEEECKKMVKRKSKKLSPVEAKDLDGLPEGWIWTKLEQIAEKIVDGTHFTPKYVASGVPFISIKDIRGGKISFEDCKYISEDEHKALIKRCNPEYNDILITKSGTIGRTAVVKTNKSFSLFVSVALIKPFKDYLESDFITLMLEDYINNIDIQQFIKGGVIKNFHIEDLKLVDFPLPPLAEQRRIVAEVERRLSVADEVARTVEQSLAQAQRLRQSILKKAFEGRLVAQNPEDEPAGVLLEKIRLQKQIKQPKKGSA